MKNCLLDWVKKNGLNLCSRALSLFLAVAMLCNMGTDALGAALFNQNEMIARISVQVENAIAETATTPSAFLSNLHADLERAVQSPSANQEVPHKYTSKEYATHYTREVEAAYAEQAKELDKAMQEALADFDVQAQAERDRVWGELLRDSDNAGAKLAEIEAYIREQRVQYEQQLNREKGSYLAELQNEKAQVLSKSKTAYKQYVKEFDKAMQEADAAQVAFYRELVNKVISSYELTQKPECMRAEGYSTQCITETVGKAADIKEDFVSIITYLSSLSNKDEIFTGEDKARIQKALWLNFTVKSRACAAGIETVYRDDAQWGSAAIGGSPSAGHSFDNAWNRSRQLFVVNERACDLAISSLVPFANLNGEGWKITNFLQDNFDNPLFGQILLVGVKALLMTKNGGMSALNKFMDAALEKENSGRKKTTWDALDVFTGEGFIRALAFDGTFFGHNVSSSAQRNPGEPNVWEDVAEMLVQANTPAATAILEKAIKQCEVVSVPNTGMFKTRDRKQQFQCRGIYPFLFGVITQKPELVNKMEVQPLYPGLREGPEWDAQGRTHYVTAQEVQARRNLNRTYGLKASQGELISGLFYQNMFEDLYPADKQRMDSKLAAIPLLNPKGQIRSYSRTSDRYRQLENKFNARVVFVALGAVFDYAISLLLLKDIGAFVSKVGALAKTASNAMKVRQVVMGYKLVPNTFGKSLAITRALKAKNLGLTQLRSYKDMTTKVNNLKNKANKIVQFPSNVVTRFREANAQKIHFGQPHTVNFDAALHGEQTLNGVRAAHRNPEGVTLFNGATVNNLRDAYTHLLKEPAKKAWYGAGTYIREGGWPGFRSTGNTKGTVERINLLDPQKATFILRDKKGNIIPLKDVYVEKGILYMNGQMAKTFKAYLPTDQLEALANLTREEKISLGIDGMWIKLVDKTKPSRWEHLRGTNEKYVTVPLYDAAGNPMVHVGFNPSYKHHKALLDVLQGENATAKLVFKDGKIHLFNMDGTLIRTLDEVTEISIPKMVFNNVIKTDNHAFLTKLFTLDKGAAGALRIDQTGNKILYPWMVNLLSYSAAASALSMTLEDAGWSPVASVLASLTLPYVTAPLAPLFAPFVERFGARKVLNTSLLLASGSLMMAMGTGWRGHGIAKGEDGKDHAVSPTWSLMLNAGLTGLAATGVRASSNLVIKSYEIGKNSLVVSMIGKSLGAMSTSLVPAVAYWAKKSEVDFSGSYPYMLAATLLTMGGLRWRIPNREYTKGFIRSARAAGQHPFREPYKLFGKKEFWPYAAGITLMGSLEGYIYFKALSAWTRDAYGEEGLGWNKPTAKFAAALSLAAPQLFWRWSGSGLGKKATRLKRFDFSRRDNFRKGVINSGILALTGGTIYAAADEDAVGWNIASGLLIGTATANIFQYTQKLMLESIERYNMARKTAGEFNRIVKDRTAMTVYSSGNFGLALPAIPAIAASQLRTGDPEHGIAGEGEVEAGKHTSWIPLMAYTLGHGMVMLQEFGKLEKVGNALSAGWHIAGPVLRPAFLATLVGVGMSNLIQINSGSAVEGNLMQLNVTDTPTVNTDTDSSRNFPSAPSLSEPTLRPQESGFGSFHLNRAGTSLSPLFVPTLPAPQPQEPEEETDEQ